MKPKYAIGFGLGSIIFLALVLWVMQLMIRAEMPEVKEPKVDVKVENGMVLEMEATGYSTGCPYDRQTANGSTVMGKGFLRIGGTEVFTVASDPHVIKTGSLVYITGLGIGLVDDTGRLIKGMKLDVCFSSKAEAIKFGKQRVKVMVLEGELR